MAISKCPKCQSSNVNNYPLNTDEYSNPDDATYQGCCHDCYYEEPYKFNKEGNFYTRGDKMREYVGIDMSKDFEVDEDFVLRFEEINGVEKLKKYICIRFELYNVNKNTKISSLVNQIEMSFTRAKCEIHSEEYKRSVDNMFVVIEALGENDAIVEAVKETQFIFSKWCKESKNNQWFR